MRTGLRAQRFLDYFLGFSLVSPANKMSILPAQITLDSIAIKVDVIKFVLAAMTPNDKMYMPVSHLCPISASSVSLSLVPCLIIAVLTTWPSQQWDPPTPPPFDIGDTLGRGENGIRLEPQTSKTNLETF